MDITVTVWYTQNSQRRIRHRNAGYQVNPEGVLTIHRNGDLPSILAVYAPRGWVFLKVAE
jgi:hypothetical protein